MAETPQNNPSPNAPYGAEPLKKSTGKVQPKKETVRINLPPKPTAAPTIKLPTLPPGTPSPASAAAAAAPAAAAIKPLDKILIFSAAFASLVAVGTAVWVFLTLQKVVQDFSS